MNTIADRVAAGAAWLDQNRPGWWQRINLDTLDLGEPCRCVLGQEYGDFYKAPLPMDLTGLYGFDSAAEFPDWDGVRPATSWEAARDAADAAEYAALTDEWRRLIKARTEAKAPA